MEEPIQFTVLDVETFRQEKGYQMVAFDQEGVEEEFYEWLENANFISPLEIECSVCGDEFRPEKPWYNVCEWCAKNTV